MADSTLFSQSDFVGFETTPWKGVFELVLFNNKNIAFKVEQTVATVAVIFRWMESP